MKTPLFNRSPRPILEPNDRLPWATGATFNPGVWYDADTVHMLFRAIPKGYTPISGSSTGSSDPVPGYDNYISYIGYASSSDGVNFTVREEPFIRPDMDFDRFGVEDPRISKIDDIYLITYTALCSPAFTVPLGERIALATTSEFKTVEKHGVIGPPVPDKDAVIFPRRIGGRIAMLHRISPDIQIVYFDDLEDLFNPSGSMWRSHLEFLDEHVLMRPQAEWEAKKIGAGPTPVETRDGWLLIYHGVDERHVYRVGLALLDLDDPRRIISRTASPVFVPEVDFELEGDIDNVVFPQGAIVIDSVLHLYYGAADRVIGHASAPLDAVLEHLRLCAVHI
ncbi:MAG: glycosidase [Bacteroidetes bacterium]|nr:glycosidase [Bacteroidota bacterium]